MSSWDRSRFIPWSMIPQDGDYLEDKKERIFRQLQKERLEEDNQLQDRSNQQAAASASTAAAQSTGDESAKTTEKIRIPYSNMELFKQAAFGGCIGTITGSVFGFMDGMRTGGESAQLQKASNMAKFRYVMQGTTRSATVFGIFFGGFHVLKYGLRVTLDPGEFSEIAMAAVPSVGVLLSQPTLRPFTPYGGMLITMDFAQIIMREMDKQR